MPEKRIKPSKKQPKMRKPRPKRQTYDIESISEDEEDEDVQGGAQKAKDAGSDEEGKRQVRGQNDSEARDAELLERKPVKKGKPVKTEDQADLSHSSSDDAEDNVPQVKASKGLILNAP